VVNWKFVKGYLKRGALEGLYAISFFVIMYFVIGFILTFGDHQISSELRYALTTLTTMILYFMAMDKRDYEKRLDEISEQVNSIAYDVDEISYYLDDEQDFTLEELEEMKREIEEDIKSIKESNN